VRENQSISNSLPLFLAETQIQTLAAATSAGRRHGHVSPEIENMANMAGGEGLNSSAQYYSTSLPAHKSKNNL